MIYNTDFLLRVGLPSSTKTYSMVKTVYAILRRNRRWYEKGKTIHRRMVKLNFTLSQDLQEEFKDYLIYYQTPEEFEHVVIASRDSDIFIDEVSNYFDADNYANIPYSYKVFLNQYAKRGNTLHATTQDASQLYTRARRKVTKILYHRKIFSNRRPTPTRPTVKRIYGWYIPVSARFIMNEVGELELKRESLFWSLLNSGWIKRKYVEMYDTTEEVKKLDYIPLGHYEYRCVNPDCIFKKTVHK